VAKPPPPARREIELELDPALPAEEPEMLPDDAILTPQPEDLVAAEQDEEVIPGEEFGREGGPIADLLSPSGAEEEIELLSISADEQVAGPRPIEAPALTAEDTDVERAFETVAPSSAAQTAHLPAKKVPLFDDLSQDAFVALVNRLRYQRHAPGELIIREGDPGRSFYIIVEGRVRIYKTGPDLKEITLAHLGEGAFFGEMALLSGAPRTANVAAEEETGILEVTDTVLRQLATRYPQVVTSLKNFYRQRLLNNVMAISPLFKDFDPSERKAIVEKFRMRQAASGEALIEQGKNSDGLYVVLHGSVQVVAQDIELARLKEGDIFGEMSLLTREPAAATVRADGNAILLRLPRESFQELVVTHPQILALVSELTEQRRTAIEAILHGQGEGHDGMSFL
jgi:CRP-like cAMP-binding protein